MKNLEKLTIDELIDYCISLKEKKEMYSELTELNNIINIKISLISDEDEREFYREVIEDVINEIESYKYLLDNESIKDKIVENTFDTFNDINTKINKELESYNCSILERISESLDSDFSPRELIHNQILESQIASYKRLLLECNNLEVFISNNYHQWIDEILINTRQKQNSHHVSMKIMGKFQRLESRYCEDWRLLGSNFLRFYDLDSFPFNSFSADLHFDKCKSAITRFKKFNESFYDKGGDMCYFKIDRKESIIPLAYHLKSYDFKTNEKENDLNHLFPKDIFWFELVVNNDVNKFNFSEVYKKDYIGKVRITWFKLTDVDNNAQDERKKFEYSKIQIDGSVTKDEVAYFNISKEIPDRIDETCLDNSQTNMSSSVLHYFIGDSSTIEKSNVPMVIGYAEGCVTDLV